MAQNHEKNTGGNDGVFFRKIRVCENFTPNQYKALHNAIQNAHLEGVFHTQFSGVYFTLGHMMSPIDVLKVLSGALVPIVALFAACIAWRQWKTASQKLKLDLYARRFGVYESTLEFCQALQEGKSSTQSERFATIQRGFIKVYRESQFLFKRESGIFELLNEIHSKSFIITGLHSEGRALASSPELLIENNQAMMESLQFMRNSIPALETKLTTYLEFRNVA